jgi:adenosylhomocysteine nucleosidase
MGAVAAVIHLFCALRSEAQPLIRHYRLQHAVEHAAFPLYLSAGLNRSLTITGTGKMAAAAALSHTAALFDGSAADAWLNVGIAGHGTSARGSTVLVNRVEDAGSGRTWYPQIVFETSLAQAGLLTVDRPVCEYDGQLRDMEGAGFCAAAMRYGTAELVQLLKIVSDTAEHGWDQLAHRDVSGMIGANLQTIDDLGDRLQELAQESAAEDRDPEHFENMLGICRFSRCQQLRLRRLLYRWEARFPGMDPAAALEGRARTASSLLRQLAVHLGGPP